MNEFVVGDRVIVYEEVIWDVHGTIAQVGYDGYCDLYVVDLDNGGDVIVMADEMELEV